MPKSRAATDLFVKLLLLGGLITLSLLSFQLTREFAFLSRRVDELEKRPATRGTPVVELPEAGASATIVATSTPKSAATPTPSPKAIVTPTPASPTAIRQTTYIPFGVKGSTTGTGWSDVLGNDTFINVTAEYGQNTYITWEVSLSTESGSGEARARLFDVTNGVAVPGSEISTTSGDIKLIQSGKLILLSGNNSYRVQISSKTSTTATFHAGRIKVVH